MKRLLLVAVSATACVSTNAAVLNPSAKYAETCPDAVQLYTSPARVPGAYREVALLNSTGNTMWTSEKGMYNSQRQKAAELGANGIVLGDINEPGAGAKVLGSFLGTGTERKGKALAIYVPAESTHTLEICRHQPPSGAGVVSATPYGVSTPPVTRPAAPSAVPEQSVTASDRPVGAEAPGAPLTPRLMDDFPAGTEFVADSSTRVYYPVACAAANGVPIARRLFYRSEASLMNAGFTRSPEC